MKKKNRKKFKSGNLEILVHNFKFPKLRLEELSWQWWRRSDKTFWRGWSSSMLVHRLRSYGSGSCLRRRKRGEGLTSKLVDRTRGRTNSNGVMVARNWSLSNRGGKKRKKNPESSENVIDFLAAWIYLHVCVCVWMAIIKNTNKILQAELFTRIQWAVQPDSWKKPRKQKILWNKKFKNTFFTIQLRKKEKNSIGILNWLRNEKKKKKKKICKNRERTLTHWRFPRGHEPRPTRKPHPPTWSSPWSPCRTFQAGPGSPSWRHRVPAPYSTQTNVMKNKIDKKIRWPLEKKKIKQKIYINKEKTFF